LLSACPWLPSFRAFGASFRSALAPGYLLFAPSALRSAQRLPLATFFRAFGAKLAIEMNIKETQPC
ncbi:MAG TPA: hypothetical protein VFH46_12175, partial [Pyrinomonadaceae bacterium]|nr:hypothetical protein [Pyrinomonadaceae bacterium]